MSVLSADPIKEILDWNGERTETIKMVADHFRVPLSPNLKVGVNEKLSNVYWLVFNFYALSVTGHIRWPELEECGPQTQTFISSDFFHLCSENGGILSFPKLNDGSS